MWDHAPLPLLGPTAFRTEKRTSEIQSFVRVLGSCGALGSSLLQNKETRFLGTPFIIRVPFFLLLVFGVTVMWEPEREKGQKVTTQEPKRKIPRLLL